jgi:hypothetical protein
MPLNDVATEQTKATEKTQATTNQRLDYLATRPDATIRYHASNMILHIHGDASYLSVSNRQIPGPRYTKQINPQCRCRHQKRGRLRSRIRSWSVLSQRPKWSPSRSYTNQAGTHTTPNAYLHG